MSDKPMCINISHSMKDIHIVRCNVTDCTNHNYYVLTIRMDNTTQVINLCDDHIDELINILKDRE